MATAAPLNLTAAEHAAITTDWKKTNQRRYQFIAREAQGLDGADELAGLQQLADLRTDMRNPF